VVKLLLERGADVNAHDESRAGDTPLESAAAACSLAMATLLVDAGADPTIPGWMQIAALHRAETRQRGDGRAVDSLLVEVAKRRPRPLSTGSRAVHRGG
jgi:ankyrin repeat protein